MKPLSDFLGPLPYHRQVLAYLRGEEEELWRWFSSDQVRAEHVRAARLELLKSSYRLEREVHRPLYALADQARSALRLEAPLTLYQAQASSSMNGFLVHIPGEAHLVLSGPLAATLSSEETVALFAHELAHFSLWHLEEGAYLTAEGVLSALADHPRAAPSHLESARLFRLYTEVFADRGALLAVPDPRVAVASLVKIETGLRDASAESYLRQAEEVFAQDRPGSGGLSHPETFIRARALRLWAEQGAGAEHEIARMIEGTPAIGSLDLLGQKRWTDLTARLVRRLVAPPWMRTPPLLAHARLYLPEDADPPGQPEPIGPPEIEGADPSLLDYLVYVLLDFAAADPELEEAPLAAAFAEAEPLGLGPRLEELAAKELGLARRRAVKVRKDASTILAEAGSGP